MQKYEYIYNFQNLGFGMFVHFGLYSIVGKGEWYLSNKNANVAMYEKLPKKFNPNKNWAKNLVKVAKSAGCKYINLTTRHHDGFSLYDTCGLNDYDAPHSKCGRDLIREFVDACNEGGVVPFFYHTLLDWHNKDYNNDFPKYIDYLIASVEILCKNYGKIGGIWFDGAWDKPNEDWQEDRLYTTIRKYQPQAMIINNTGMVARGKVGHKEIDSVTFERGNPYKIDNDDKPIAGEMCQVLNDHWGYAKEDCNFKSMKEIIENLVDCRICGCNLLLNTGAKANGEVNLMDKAMFAELGKWVKKNKNFIYKAKPVDCEKLGYKLINEDNYNLLEDENNYYVVIKDVAMSANLNVALYSQLKKITLPFNVKRAVWLDNGKAVKMQNKNSFTVQPFDYGVSYTVRIAKIDKQFIY